MKKILLTLLLVLSNTVLAADKMVVGYYPSWISGSYPPSGIPWQYLTHIAHAFIGPLANGGLDVPGGFVSSQLIQTAHAHSAKVVVSVGGWNTTYDNNFTALAADSAARRAFASNLKQFCVTNGYDGADIDWEYPGSATDRANHALMIHAIRQAFDAAVPRLTLSMAGPATNWSGQWFDFAATAGDFDWIGIMTYDYYGNWSSVAGPNAALYGNYPPNDQGWTDFSVNYYSNDRAVPKTKLLTGVPFYGWTFNAASLYGATSGSPKAVQEYYSTIAPRLAQGWTRTWDASGQVPYMQDAGHTKLSSYDDSTSVALKAAYVQSKGIAGVILWALGQDVVGGKAVLLETVGKALRPVTGVAEELQAPSTFVLSQNYPNPFNPLTTIAYSVGLEKEGETGRGGEWGSGAMVRLSVYDLLGREVAVLVNQQQAPGRYEVRFDGARLASGVYLYKLQAGSFAQYRRMMLVK